jgi:probable rRNA maturation factor
MLSLQIADSISAAVPPSIQKDSFYERIISTTLQHLNITGSDTTILITGDDHIQSLNRDYLGENSPTDVLAFPAGHTDPDTNTLNLGDIVISYPRVEEQAQAGGHPIEQEMELLVVHGLLHLLGYDHLEENQKSEMWTIQEEVLRKLGNNLSIPLSDVDPLDG